MTTEITPQHLADLLGRLDQDGLRAAIARGASVDRVAAWTAGIARPIAGCIGYAARKALVAFDFVDGDGRAGRVGLALKHFAGWKGRGEASAYRWLETVNAPVPRMAGALSDEHGDEVLLLELLPHVGCEPSDAEAVLSSLARLNALPEPPPGALADPPYDLAAMAKGAVEYFPRMAADARAGLLGEEIRALIVDGEPLWPLLESYFAPVVADLEALPVGLTHGDSGPQNVGWRADRRELLLFDLHKLRRGCILWDMTAHTGDGGSERDERLARHWLAELRRAGGPEISEAALLRGRLAHRRLCGASGWWWQHSRSVDGAVDWTSDREEGRRVYRGWLAGNLRALRDDLAERAGGRAAMGGAS